MATRTAPSVPGLRRSRWTRFKAGVAARLGWLWKPQLYTGLLLAFLLGRALPGAEIAPFGIAFFIAVRAVGFRGIGALAIGGSTILGAWTIRSSPSQFAAVVLAILIGQLLASLLRLGVKGPTPLRAAVLSAIVSLIPAIMVQEHTTTVSLLFFCSLTGVLSLVFTLGLQDAISGRMFLVASSEAPVPAIVLLACAFCGLEGLPSWGPVSLHHAAASALVMLSAFYAGPAMGAAVGAVLGISFLFTSVADKHSLESLADARSLAYVIPGLMAGTFRDLWKPGVALGFSFSLLAYAALQDKAEFVAWASSALAGTILFILTPTRLLSLLPDLLVRRVEPVREKVETGPPPANATAERVRGVARVLREVGRTFEQVAAVAAPAELNEPNVYEQVTDRVCSSCSMFRQCWETDYEKTSQLYLELWTQLSETGLLPTHPAPEKLEKHCIYSPQVAFTLNYLHDLHRSRLSWDRRIAEGRSLAGDYVRNVSRMLERLADETAQLEGKARMESTPVMRAVSAVARLPKRGVHISGDSYVATQLGQERFLLALSDGMGVGKGAASESKQCVTLLEQILSVGMATEVAVNTVNSVLLLRSTEEAFATVDLTLLDLTTGRAEFVKIGAAPTFLKRGSEVTVIKHASVPVGILSQVQVEPEFRQLRPGDLIVMITDGIWDVSKEESDKERWLIQHLSREHSADPEEIAEGVLAKALELMPEASDDMTVLVALVEPIASARQSENFKFRPHSGWVPARTAPRLRK